VAVMRKEYNIEELNPRKNPYSKRLKKQITININDDTISYFKKQSKEVGIPYQALINLYLSDCVNCKRKLQLAWA
jgi:predicted DNA binding CopG/RHH family protein